MVGNWSREGSAKAMRWEQADILRGMGALAEEELEDARRLKGRPRRCRSDVALSMGLVNSPVLGFDFSPLP